MPRGIKILVLILRKFLRGFSPKAVVSDVLGIIGLRPTPHATSLFLPLWGLLYPHSSTDRCECQVSSLGLR